VLETQYSGTTPNPVVEHQYHLGGFATGTSNRVYNIFLIIMVLTACDKPASTGRARLRVGSIHPASLEPTAVVGAPGTCNGNGFYRPGGPVKPAVPIFRVRPVYNTAATAPWRESIILAEAFVDQEGNVCGAGIVWHATPALDEETLRAFRQWKFHAATLNGRPTNSVFSATFRIESER
jgi:hypothetical protein